MPRSYRGAVSATPEWSVEERSISTARGGSEMHSRTASSTVVTQRPGRSPNTSSNRGRLSSENRRRNDLWVIRSGAFAFVGFGFGFGRSRDVGSIFRVLGVVRCVHRGQAGGFWKKLVFRFAN